MKKRSVLIDLRYLGIAHGFGEFCYNYGTFIKEHPELIKDLDITLLVPKNYVGYFGDHVKYLTIKRIYKLFPQLFPYFDVWHNTTQQAKYSTKNKKTKKIICIHDLNFLYEKSKGKATKRLKKLQHYIDTVKTIVVISKFTENEVKNNLNVAGKDIIVNYVGNKDLLKEKTEEPSFIKDNKKKFLFTISKIGKKKNTHVLIDIMRKLPEYDLYICGNTSSEYAQEIIDKIKKENIQNIIIPGQISFEEKMWMYKNCYGFLFPSLFEGFGAPVIEAMQFGKPVFCSKCTSLPEIGSEYAFYFENFEPNHMSEIIKKNIDPFYLNTNKIESEVRYSHSFDIDSHMKTIIKLYRSI